CFCWADAANSTNNTAQNTRRRTQLPQTMSAAPPPSPAGADFPQRRTRPLPLLHHDQQKISERREVPGRAAPCFPLSSPDSSSNNGPDRPPVESTPLQRAVQAAGGGFAGSSCRPADFVAPARECACPRHETRVIMKETCLCSAS